MRVPDETRCSARPAITKLDTSNEATSIHDFISDCDHGGARRARHCWPAREHLQRQQKANHPFYRVVELSEETVDPAVWGKNEPRARVETIQDRTFQVRNLAMDALVALIGDIKAAQTRGAARTTLETARRHQRRAQFLLDFIETENSMGFHAGQEAVRIVALSLDETRRGQASLAGLTTVTPPAAWVDRR